MALSRTGEESTIVTGTFFGEILHEIYVPDVYSQIVVRFPYRDQTEVCVLNSYDEGKHWVDATYNEAPVEILDNPDTLLVDELNDLHVMHP